jgi:AICAR transformylase/IMP cyclohydrolase PurH
MMRKKRRFRMTITEQFLNDLPEIVKPEASNLQKVKDALKEMCGENNVCVLRFDTLQSQTGLSYNEIYETLMAHNQRAWDIDNKTHERVTYIHIRGN